MPADKGFALFVRLTRIKAIPLVVAPACVGAALAWERHGGPFCYGWFAFFLVGSVSMHLGANILNDVQDEESGADNFARRDQYALATGSGVLGAGVLSKAKMLGFSAAFFSVALLCGVVLAFSRGPVVIVIGGAGFLLAYFYSGKPVRYGYVGHGLGEAGFFFAFGVLPVAGAYYVQARGLDAAGLAASVVPSLPAMIALFSHNFLHSGADAEARKMTPVAVLGVQPALVLARIFVVAFVVAAAVLTLAFRVWPAASVVVVLVALPMIVTQSSAAHEPGLESFVRMLGAALGACVLGDSILVVSSIVRVLAR